ncbi:adenylyltransferase/cytidyltransferase family protein [Vibrio sp. 10N.261.52.A1]|uniref:adenylyltransferase/cytidyltransferase family protein n=1 Tax=Vibrio TaxID=662 RepID=UPI000C81AC0F|nr:adenylyltransferase/cytidyltransferase family protein [Vibrio sp. 10N.261.52.A1]
MKVIGYTTGVFDMFHIGHLNLLRRAKLECDYLIVGVTTDELSASHKGKNPIISFDERMEIVNAIEFVDEVVPQINYDKFEAWEKIKFNKMFVGDDWKGTSKWKNIEERFKPKNVEIVYFQYTSKTSSTKLRSALEKIGSE